MAKKMFSETSGAILKPISGLPCKAVAWPLLEKMVHLRCLSYTDLSLAHRLLRHVPAASEEAAALLCHLSAAARRGHLCVRIAGGDVYPTVADIWQPSGDEGMCAEGYSALFVAISQKIAAGSSSIPAQLLAKEDLSAAGSQFGAVCRQGDLCYLQRYWQLESDFLQHVYPLFEGDRLGMRLEAATVSLAVEALLAANKLLPEQAQAIYQGCLHPFTVIIGGPGTGKTHTAGLLVKVLWESLSTDQRAGCKIALAAPTGKAAANLQGSIQRALQDVLGFPKLSAQTLHALLGAGKPRQNHHILSADVLLIDESSMIDAQMMALLMQSLKPGARLIMLGDKHQLPPVEAGSLFAELVEVLQASSQYKKSVIELHKCLRAELQGIIDLAASINAGNAKHTLEALAAAKDDNTETGLRFVPLQTGQQAKEVQRQLLAYCLAKFPSVDALPSDFLATLQQFARFRMLTPLRKGPYGVEELNRLFFEAALTRASRSACLIAPIMIEKNDYRAGLFNGEVGLLIKPRPVEGRFQKHLSPQDYAVFAAKSGDGEAGGVRQIPALLLPAFDYAYCLSIHKSQGSEFEHVLLLVPEGSEQFGREALYTGATRARQKLEVWGHPEALQQMIERHSKRHSGVIDRLQSLLNRIN